MNETYRYTLELFRPDGTAVGQVALDEPLAIDWVPAEEWVRFQAIRRSGASGGGRGEIATPSVEPIWHTKLREPYLAGFRVSVSTGDTVTASEFGTDYFRSLVERATVHFVAKGALTEGERVVYVAAAFPRAAQRVAAQHAGVTAHDVSVPLRLRDSRLDEFARGCPAVGAASADDMPVLVPQQVLDEAASLARGAGECETGGILIGHLHRDAASRDVFAEITAQIPARHTAATSSRLTFTAETWTDVRAAIALRRSDEAMLGWWHSHPVRVWCRNCSTEKQAVCPLAAGFFSEQDRALHRAVFPAAYSVGLLVNDVSWGPTFSLFGWQRGVLAPRGFLLTGATGGAIVSGDEATGLVPCGEGDRSHDDAQYTTAGR